MVHITRQCGLSKTCSVPLLTIGDAAGMLCRFQTRYHAFSDTKSTTVLFI